MTKHNNRNQQLIDCVAKIVARASFLRERQNKIIFRPDVTNFAEEIVRERLDRLSNGVMGRDIEAFDRWLQWSNLGTAEVETAVQEVELVDPTILPPWAELLLQVIEVGSSPKVDQQDKGGALLDLPCMSSSGQVHMKSVYAHRDPDNPIPFQDILFPMLIVAREKLLGRFVHRSWDFTDVLPLTLISSGAYAAMERSLLYRLSYITAQTLGAEFARTRPVGTAFLISIGAAESGEQGAPTTRNYDPFVDHMLSDGLLSFFECYPVLARFVVVVIDQWVDATTEFLEHLQKDLARIEQVFCANGESKEFGGERNLTPGLVTAVDPGLSDRHNGGHSTMCVTFESGLKLMYKPKSIQLERNYADLLDWCNGRGLSLELMTHKVLDCNSHGWSEFIPFTACQDEEAVSRFYRRAGMQLCLLYALGASDCHSENLIACGEHLVLVDMETLFSSDPPPISIDADFGSFDSVLRTGLLPSWECRFDTQFSPDVSGLGFVASQPLPDRRWIHANTDTMRLGWGVKPAKLLANVPVLGTAPQTPADHVNELVDGFEEMYHLILSHREPLLSAEGPIATMKGQAMRFVFRPTIVYLTILEQALTPACLQSGVDLSIQLANLCQAFVVASEKPKSWPILAAELDAAEQLDVPHFTLNTDGTTLTSAGAELVENYFARSGLDECVSRIHRMSDMDKVLQSELIRGTVYCGIAGVHTGGSYSVSSDHATETELYRMGEKTLPNRYSLVQAACSIADEIQRRSIQIKNGNIDWLGPIYSPQTDRMQVNLLGDNLFDGRCGIALFLAACARITGEQAYRALALAALHPLRQSLHASTKFLYNDFGRGIGIGGATGLGSIIYSLVKVGRFLDDASLISDAHLAAGCIKEADIERDRHLDVINGAAGAALSLLALYKESRNPESLRLAVFCGERMLESQRRERAFESHRLNLAAFRKPGFAHGIAGISYVLLRLYEVTQDHRFRDAAEEIVDAEIGKDLSQPKDRYAKIQAPLMGTWCNGIPGILLARLGSLSILKNSTIEEQIEETVRITESWSLDGVDHVCCGNFGRIETLLVAADKLARSRLQSAVREKMAGVIDRASHNRAYQLQGELFGAPYFDSSFFHGVSGIGYGLLRIANPDRLPCVLLWE